jgi:hypothetical protein
MFIEPQQSRSSPPLDYMDRTPSSMENEVYLAGMPGSPKGQRKYTLKQGQHGTNPCKEILRFIRSNGLFLYLVKEYFLIHSRILGNTTNGKTQSR